MEKSPILGSLSIPNFKIKVILWLPKFRISLLVIYKTMSKLQVLSFMFILNCRWCPLPLKLIGFVLYVSKSYTLCPLGPTQFKFSVK
ncbi:hypothetical protein Hanom_Chr07g00635031 [Helianthus anomalus]